jgi:hypothetical protein
MLDGENIKISAVFNTGSVVLTVSCSVVAGACLPGVKQLHFAFLACRHRQNVPVSLTVYNVEKYLKYNFKH